MHCRLSTDTASTATLTNQDKAGTIFSSCERFNACQGTAATDGHMELNKYCSPPLTSFSLMQLERVEEPSEASCDGNAGQGSISFKPSKRQVQPASTRCTRQCSQLMRICPVPNAAQRMTHWADGGAENQRGTRRTDRLSLDIVP